MPVIYRPFLEKLGGQISATTYIGNAGDLFYDPATTTLRVSNGTTPGGTAVSGGGGANTGNFTFSANTMTSPAGGIITAPDAQEFQLQAKDTNSLLRNEINLDPNNGTYMSVWSEELNASFSAVDWDTASWVNEGGGVGAAYFTNAEDLQDFWTIGVGSFVNSIEVSINGGTRVPVQYEGNDGEQYGVVLAMVGGVPATSPTTITSLNFFYRTKSSINIDYDGGQMLLDAQSMNITLETSNDLDLRSGQDLTLMSTGQSPVRIYTDSTTNMWDFNNTGDLTLPREGKIYGLGLGPAGDRAGYISWSGNTSGDGSGYNTLRLVPDLQGLEDADQYIILDPTSPGHIHIRAGGTQDNSQAILYFGGENSHVKIDSGPNPAVTVMANNKPWSFGTNGTTTFPTGGLISNYSGGSGANNDSWFVTPGNGTGGVSSQDGQQYIQINNNLFVEIGTSFGTANAATWRFGRDGTLTFPNSSVQTGGAISITELKALVANAATYGAFQTAIANL
jgi:hypothetical protein